MSSTVPPAGKYTIDVARSNVSFVTTHLFGLGKVRGTFAIDSGTVTVASPPEASSIRVELPVASFSTGSRGRDTAVCSPRFLNAERFPVITFTSSSASSRGGDWEIVGQLHVAGNQAPVTLKVTNIRVSDTELEASATCRIDRTRFGITAAKGMAGRDLDITISVIATRDDG